MAERALTSPDTDLQGLLVEPPDVVPEVLLQQEGDLVLQHLRRRPRSATPAGDATAIPGGWAEWAAPSCPRRLPRSARGAAVSRGREATGERESI